ARGSIMSATAMADRAAPEVTDDEPRARQARRMESRGAAGSSPFGALRRAFLASPIYRLTLMGPVPREFRRIPRDPWPGESAHGEELRRLEAEILESMRFARGTGEPARQAWLHGFRWLRDLRALGGDEARRQARELVATWILEHENWSEIAWRPDVLGAR